MPPIASTTSDGLLETNLNEDQPPSSGSPLPKYYEDEDIIAIVNGDNEIVAEMEKVEEEEPKYARVDLTKINKRRRRENR